jgi:hypothetical protein
MEGHRLSWLGVIAMLAIMLPFGLLASLPAAANEAPDQVLAWNQHPYQELIVEKQQAPPVAVLHLAMVHGEIYDAVNAIDGGYEPYLGAPDAEASDCEDAAAAAAGYRVLLGLIPDRAAQASCRPKSAWFVRGA